MENTSHFGKKVATLRVLTELTQEELSDVMHCSRISVSNIERTESLDDISMDLTFRIYYFCQVVQNNETFEPYVRELSKTIQGKITDKLDQ